MTQEENSNIEVKKESEAVVETNVVETEHNLPIQKEESQSEDTVESTAGEQQEEEANQVQSPPELEPESEPEQKVEVLEDSSAEEEIEKEAVQPEAVAEEIEHFEAPVNKDALAKQEKEFNFLNETIEALELGFEENRDARSIRKTLVGLKESLSALFLIPLDQRNEIDQRIQEVFELVSSRQAKEREERNKIFDENFNKYKPTFDIKIEEAEGKLSNNLKETRLILISLQKEMKSISFRPSDRDVFFKSIQNLFDKINMLEGAEREAFEMECAENYLRFKPRVEFACNKEKTSDDLNNARKILISLQKELRDVKLSRKERDELYGTIRLAFDEINAKQDNERKAFGEVAEKNYLLAKPMVDTAILFASDPKNSSSSRNHLIETQKKLKQLALTRRQSDELFGEIRAIFSKLNQNTEEMTEEFKEISKSNFVKLELKISEAIANVEYSNNFRDIREGLIDVQDEVKIIKLTRSHRNELLARIRKGFKKFDSKRKDFLRRREVEKRKKLEEKIKKLEQKNENIEKLIKEDESFLVKIKEGSQESIDLEKVKTLEQKISSGQANVEENLKRIAEINAGLEKKI